MKRQLTKYQEWRKSVVVRRFRSHGEMTQYIAGRPEEGWRAVANITPKTMLVFGEAALQEGLIFESNIGKFVDGETLSLIGSSVDDFVDNFNIPDIDGAPILVDYFKRYIANPDEISNFALIACQLLVLPIIRRESDIQIFDEWVRREMLERVKPAFYSEDVYAKLIVAVGEFFRMGRSENELTKWEVRRIRAAKKSEDFPEIFIYVPFLIDANGVGYDLLHSFRQNLFLSDGVKGRISRVYKNINAVDESIPRKWSY